MPPPPPLPSLAPSSAPPCAISSPSLSPPSAPETAQLDYATRAALDVLCPLDTSDCARSCSLRAAPAADTGLVCASRLLEDVLAEQRELADLRADNKWREQVDEREHTIVLLDGGHQVPP